MKQLIYSIAAMLIALTSGAQTSFTEVGTSAGVTHQYYSTSYMGGGVAWFDYNNDGHMDLYLGGGQNEDQLYHNNGNGSFTAMGTPSGIGAITNGRYTMGVTTGDIDNDGFRDVFVTTMIGDRNILMKNNGDGTFTDISVSSGIADVGTTWGTSASFGDYNLDGYLDLYAVNYVETAVPLTDTAGNGIGFAHECYQDFLFMNRGDGTFLEIGALTGAGSMGCGLAATLTDFDSDNDVDIMVANDFGQWVLPNRLMQNEYPVVNIFTDVSDSSGYNRGMYGMGVAIGDYDQDCDLDYYITNIGLNSFYENQGDGTFNDIATPAGVGDEVSFDTFNTVGWGTAFFDIDNNTYLDLYVANGYVPAFDFLKTNLYDADRMFYNNNGNGTFTDVSSTVGIGFPGVCHGMGYADYDNDGDNDIAVSALIEDIDSLDRIQLYRNDLSNSNNYLKVKLTGTRSNRDAFGSKIKIKVGAQSWVQEINGGSSHMSQNSSIAHFGLGTATTVDSLTIIWPDGEETEMAAVSINQLLEVVEDSSLLGNDTVYVIVFDTTIVSVNDTQYVTSYDTTFITINDTTIINAFDTVTTTVYDTVTVTIYDTVYITTYDTTTITTYDTINITNYDTTSIVVYDTSTVTIYDSTHVTISVFDTVTTTIYDTVYQQIFINGIGELNTKPPSLEAHPNPFHGRTNLQLYIPRSGIVRFSIYDLSGKEVISLHDGYIPDGSYTLAWEPDILSPGVYVARLVYDGKTISRKLLLF